MNSGSAKRKKKKKHFSRKKMEKRETEDYPERASHT
jgi:hypothetical protein